MHVLSEHGGSCACGPLLHPQGARKRQIDQELTDLTRGGTMEIFARHLTASKRGVLRMPKDYEVFQPMTNLKLACADCEEVTLLRQHAKSHQRDYHSLAA